MHMYTYFEPLLVKPRLVPLNPTEKLLHHSNVYVISVSSYCSDLKKLHCQSLSKTCLMESFIIQGGGVLETTTKFHLLNSIQALILVHESWCGLAWPGFFALALCIPISLTTCCQETITSVSSWTAPDNRHKRSPGPFLTPSKGVGFARDYP